MGASFGMYKSNNLVLHNKLGINKFRSRLHHEHIHA